MGHRGIHYLDDHLFLGHTSSQQCADSLTLALLICETLGVPVSAEIAFTSREASSFADDNWNVEEKAQLHEAGARFTDWAAAVCMQSGTTWLVIPSAHD